MSLSVIDAPPNRPPYFTSVPVVDAQVNAPYTYDADAVDPDSDALEYTLLVEPQGMSIDEATGVLTWSPASSQVGMHDVTLSVTDGQGGSATQSFLVHVNPDPSNNPPVIVSEPVTTAVLVHGYTYEVDAIDPDDDPIAYSLVQNPDGMTIDADTGQIYWSTPSLDASLEFAAAFSAIYIRSDLRCDLRSPGNLYITGQSVGTMDIDPGPDTVTLAGNLAFVAKFSPDNTLIWATGMPTTGEAGADKIVVDEQGNVFVTGSFTGVADFDPGPNQWLLTHVGGNHNGFVLKLDSEGRFCGRPTSPLVRSQQRIHRPWMQ